MRRSCGSAARTTRPRCRSPTARSRRCSRASPRMRARPGARHRSSSSTRPTPSSWARSLLGLRRRLPEPGRRPDGEQGLRAGRAPCRLRDRPSRADRPHEPVPAAGLGLHRLGHARHRGAARSDSILDDNVARVDAERDRLTEALRGCRLDGRPVGHELRAGRPRLDERAAAVAEGLLAAWPRAADVPRRPSARRPPPPHGPRRRRERPTDRGRHGADRGRHRRGCDGRGVTSSPDPRLPGKQGDSDDHRRDARPDQAKTITRFFDAIAAGDSPPCWRS